jgi:hypothetical protein
MHSTLWPVKLFSLFQALEQQGVLKAMTPPTCFAVDAPDDGLTRIYLNHPDVQNQVRRQFKLRDFRLRIAYPAPLAFMPLVDGARFEIYGAEDRQLVQEPILLCNLNPELSAVIELEFLTKLLETTGIAIPTM